MAIVKSEAFVLKTLKYGESSKIVSLFTRNFGKISAIVKGARNLKSKFGGTLESMNYIDAILYLKHDRDLQLLSGAEYRRTFPMILKDFDKLAVAYRIIEIANKSVISNDANPLMFDLLIDVYTALDSAVNKYNYYILLFQIEIAKILGVRPDFSESHETFFNDNEFYVRKSLVKFLNSVERNKLENISSLKIGDDDMDKLIKCFERYLAQHSQGFNFFTTTKIFNQLI